MQFHSNTLTGEFIAYLRDAAIRSKQAPAVIDLIDSLGRVEVVEAEVEKVGGELYDMEQNRDDLDEALTKMLDALENVFDDLRKLDANAKTDADYLREAMQNAKDALTRSGVK